MKVVSADAMRIKREAKLKIENRKLKIESTMTMIIAMAVDYDVGNADKSD